MANSRHNTAKELAKDEIQLSEKYDSKTSYLIKVSEVVCNNVRQKTFRTVLHA